jgi:hypothetical protein
VSRHRRAHRPNIRHAPSSRGEEPASNRAVERPRGLVSDMAQVPFSGSQEVEAGKNLTIR